jgi:hypothetical protein
VAVGAATYAFSAGGPVLSPSQPATPATGVAVENANAYACQVVIGANGATITNVSVNGVTVGVAAGTYVVPAFGSISIAYSVATPTMAWTAASGSGIACTATWAPGSTTLTDTVTSGGAFLASFAGQSWAPYLATPLPGWQFGNPS